VSEDSFEARERRITLGRQAKDVLENPAYKEAVEFVMQDIWAQFQATEANDTETREKLWMVSRNTRAIHNRLTGLVSQGSTDEAFKADELKRERKDN